MKPVTIALSDPAEHFLVDAFYADVGYRGHVSSSDRVIVAYEGADVVGALRLCEEEGELVLRGVYVRPDRRGRGIGSAMLRKMEPLIAERPCWCVPYTHLMDFYAQVGFEEAGVRGAPGFLADRLRRYEEEGSDVVILLRPSAGERR